ncbi:hypothetical protein SAMN06265346_101621 [Flavobacterium hercynium]|nr:hypothetical protein SAMN06265346_101621 [Flavobacterium hercynium]
MLFIPILVLSLLIGVCTFLLFAFLKKEYFRTISIYCLCVDCFFILFYSLLFGVLFILKKINIYTIPHGIDTYGSIFLIIILLIFRKLFLLYMKRYFLLLNMIMIFFSLLLVIYGYENYNSSL